MDKPAGLLSMGNEKERARTAYRMVSDYVKAREPGGRIFIVHRLDRYLGVLVFAKNERMKRAPSGPLGGAGAEAGLRGCRGRRPPEPEGTVRSLPAGNDHPSGLFCPQRKRGERRYPLKVGGGF